MKTPEVDSKSCAECWENYSQQGGKLSGFGVQSVQDGYV
jgi:hypothetical protein